ncbi:MAG: hypothetical protein LBI49_01350 [Nocardiopsaceae bacterium]|jgi:hypothetical protein|nr:hypothetical protein [Nocardiopsaceae bacterium]
MNDDELITAVREQRDKLPMTVPAEQVISRGRVLRARRRMAGLAGALAVVVATAVAFTALAPAGPGRGSQARARPVAWTVTMQPDGGVKVTLRELPDPARLQRKLRADGIPARVIIDARGHQAPNDFKVPGCHVYGVGAPGGTPVARWQDVFFGPHVHDKYTGYDFWVYPPALPAGRGVGIFVSIGADRLTNHHQRIGADHGYGVNSYSLYLVDASPRCTGS